MRTVSPAFLALVVAAGCASATKTGGHAPEADGALARGVSRQASAPDRKAMTAPPPPGVPLELTAPLTADGLERAGLSLEQALARTPSQEDRTDVHAGAPSEDERLDAMQAYVLGRARRLDGDLQNALEDLRHAAKLDPGSPAIWRELAEAESAAGNRTGAASAFKRAAELDPTDIRSLEMLSRGAIERREYDEALRILVRLRSLDTASYDPALPSILGVRLGRVLFEQGYLRAGAEALRAALELPDRFSATTNYSADLAQLYRQRGDLWRDMGDAALRRGEALEAASDYAEAASLPGMNPGSILSRRVYALMRAGRSAEASALVVEEAASLKGRIDDRTQALIRHIAQSSDSGPALSRALAELQATLSPDERARAVTPLARARAAALSGPAAIHVLQDHLRERPADVAVVRDLLSRLPTDPPGTLLDEVIRLIEATPILEPRYSGTLLNGPVEPATLLEGWSSVDAGLSESGGGHVLHARLLAASGDFGSAESELAGIPATATAAQAAIVARVEVLIRLGRTEDAFAAMNALDEHSSKDARAAKATALTQLGEPEAALEMLRPLLDAPSDSATIQVDRLLLAARLCVILSRPEAVRQFLEEARAIDPLRDEPYAGLIALYKRGGPLASDAKLIETVRALMASNPSSPTLRWLRAQEAFGRGQMDLAERDLLDLAEEYPDRDSVVELLVQVWRNTRSLEKAEQWLRAQSLRRPWESVYDLELAGVLMDQKRTADAIALLERRLSAARGDNEVSRRLERIYLDSGQTERAEALTSARLARAPHSPEAVVELADLSLRQGDAGKAKATLEPLLSQNQPLSPETLERLSQLCIDAGKSVVSGRTPLPGPHVELVLYITAQRPQVALPAHLAAIQMLARTQGAVDAIIACADRAGKQYPSLSASIFSTAFTELVGQGGGLQARRQARPADALKVLEHACTMLKPPPAKLLAMWLAYSERVEGTNSPAVFIRVLELARDTDTIDALLLEFQRSGQPEDAAAAAADTAHRWANSAQNNDREDLALWLYRVSLEHNPNHVMSNNNLGYSLLKHDESVREAAALITRAYQGMLKDPQPDERSSITDSMGWACYRMGVIHDVPAQADRPATEGAVTLLTKASELAASELAANAKKLAGLQDPLPAALLDVGCIIDDHLGDALWQAGQRERAIELWTGASGRAGAMLKAIRDLGERGRGSNEREIEDVAAGAKSKAEAARAGQVPAVARMIAPMNSAPAEPMPAVPASPAPTDSFE